MPRDAHADSDSARWINFVYVDYENVQEIDLRGDLGVRLEIILVVGKHQNDLPTVLVKQLLAIPGSHEVVVVAPGKNAADMVLISHLGSRIFRDKRDYHHIISKDGDFDPLVAHYRAEGYHIGRFAAFSEFRASLSKPLEATVVFTEKLNLIGREKVESLFEKLKANTSNRPKTRKTFLAHAMTQLGLKDSNEACESEIFASAQTWGVMFDAKGKAVYPAEWVAESIKA